MKSIHGHEEYKCSYCEVKFTKNEVKNTWKCNKCSKLVSIKWNIENCTHNCHRISPAEAEIGMLVVLSHNKAYQILNIEENAKEYKIALKGWKVERVKASDYLFIINGIWTEDDK